MCNVTPGGGAVPGNATCTARAVHRPLAQDLHPLTLPAVSSSVGDKYVDWRLACYDVTHVRLHNLRDVGGVATIDIFKGINKKSANDNNAKQLKRGATLRV